MTNPVASGLKTTPSISMGASLDSADKAADASKKLPNWSRDASKTDSTNHDAKSMLKTGLGPRPGGLDDAPIKSQDSDASSKPQSGKPLGSRLDPTAIASAARRAIDDNLRNNKMRVFLHPKASVAMAVVGFFSNLIKGKGKSE